MKKFIKIFALVIIGLIILCCTGIYVGSRFYKEQFFTASKNRITITRNEGPFHFEWAPSNFDGFEEPHGAIYFPVYLQGIDEVFWMQWDSGATTTIFYQPSILSLLKGSSMPDTIMRGTSVYFREFSLSVGEHIDFTMEYMRLMDYGSPIDLNDSTGNRLLGTIGADFIDGQIFSMNFKTREVKLSQDRSTFGNQTFIPFTYVGRRVLLPATIKDSEALLFYDSGTSPFGLVTTKGKFEDYGDPEAEELVYGINSWGTKVSCHNKSSRVPIQFGQTTVEMNRVSYMQWKDFAQSFFMTFSDIKGLLGNKSLLESTLILDTKKSEFTIVN